MHDHERRAELLLAAAIGEPLGPDDTARLEQLLAADPTARKELDEIAETLSVLRRPTEGGWAWDSSAPPPGLKDRILAATAPAPTTARFTWRPAVIAACAAGLLAVGAAGLLAVGAAGLLAVGAAGGWGFAQLGDAPPSGPPGTPGVIEPVAFAAEPAGVDIDAAVVAHTWGTEAVFEVTGLDPGSTYQVVVVGRDGVELLAGSFLATEGSVFCRMNAAVLRQEAAALTIRGPAGQDVLRAELPPVEVAAAG